MAAEPPEEETIELVATTSRPPDDLADDIPTFSVTFDPRFQILLRVDEMLRGEAPVAVGEQMVLLIHSPTMTFAGRDYDGRQFVFELTVRDEGGPGERYVLSGLDTWPRSRQPREARSDDDGADDG